LPKLAFSALPTAVLGQLLGPAPQALRGRGARVGPRRAGLAITTAFAGVRRAGTLRSPRRFPAPPAGPRGRRSDACGRRAGGSRLRRQPTDLADSFSASQRNKAVAALKAAGQPAEGAAAR